MRLYILTLLSVILMGCHKEAALSPSLPEMPDPLPQGNNSYDDTIKACFDKYQTYILYRFDQADYSYDHISKKTDSAFNANPAYISPVLRLLHEHLFGFLPENFLKKTMPYKILLASYIGGGTARSATGFDFTYASLTVGWADSTLLNINSPAMLKTLRVNMIRAYMARAYRSTALNVPQEFLLSMPAKLSYANINSVVNKNQCGVIEPWGTQLNVGTDFLGYIQAIATRTKTDIENTYFRPNVDVNGLYKKKYNIVVAYFQSEFGFDLQELGNRF
jgi:hypothetical protein